jgi:hypothetical protein
MDKEKSVVAQRRAETERVYEIREQVLRQEIADDEKRKLSYKIATAFRAFTRFMKNDKATN